MFWIILLIPEPVFSLKVDCDNSFDRWVKNKEKYWFGLITFNKTADRVFNLYPFKIILVIFVFSSLLYSCSIKQICCINSKSTGWKYVLSLLRVVTSFSEEKIKSFEKLNKVEIWKPFLFEFLTCKLSVIRVGMSDRN